MRHRRWALVACGAAVLSLGAGRCGATSGQAISSHNLRIYVSDPALVKSDQAAQDVVDAEKLAFSQKKSQVSGFQLSLGTLEHARASDNARQAISDTQHAIAYLGEIVPGSSAASVGITNAQDLLQVSPTDTASALTRKSPAVAGSPQHYYESFGTYGQTFARVIPSTRREAAVLLGQMGNLGVKTLHVETDGTDYGRALGSEVTTAEAGRGISPASSSGGADAILYAGSSWSGAAGALRTATAANPHAKLFVPSALADAAFCATLPVGVQRALYATAPGPAIRTAAGRKFAADFRTTYGHAPAPEAAFGYAAMEVVLDALRTAASGANNRSTVVGEVLKHSFGGTVLGAITIDRFGDSSFAGFQIERVRAGRLVAVNAVQG